MESTARRVMYASCIQHHTSNAFNTLSPSSRCFAIKSASSSQLDYSCRSPDMLSDVCAPSSYSSWIVGSGHLAWFRPGVILEGIPTPAFNASCIIPDGGSCRSRLSLIQLTLLHATPPSSQRPPPTCVPLPALGRERASVTPVDTNAGYHMPRASITDGVLGR